LIGVVTHHCHQPKQQQQQHASCEVVRSADEKTLHARDDRISALGRRTNRQSHLVPFSTPSGGGVQDVAKGRRLGNQLIATVQ